MRRFELFAIASLVLVILGISFPLVLWKMISLRAVPKLFLRYKPVVTSGARFKSSDVHITDWRRQRMLREMKRYALSTEMAHILAVKRKNS
jgi:hypothetical protein